MKIEGINDLIKDLEKLKNNLKEIDGLNSVPINDLFPSSFMRKHTQFHSIDAFFDASGFKIETQNDFDSIPGDDWDRYVSMYTSFSSWDDMMSEAAVLWSSRKIGL